MICQKSIFVCFSYFLISNVYAMDGKYEMTNNDLEESARQIKWTNSIFETQTVEEQSKIFSYMLHFLEPLTTHKQFEELLFPSDISEINYKLENSSSTVNDRLQKFNCSICNNEDKLRSILDDYFTDNFISIDINKYQYIEGMINYESEVNKRYDLIKKMASHLMYMKHDVVKMCNGNVLWKCRALAIINFTQNNKEFWHQEGGCIENVCTMHYIDISGIFKGTYKFREVQNQSNDITYYSYEVLKEGEIKYQPFYVRLV
ncbi:uncharacterized protein LOC126896732 [Daktulosphaira vitifoliae]|uniref:uncharacterized protein LOC126896732 n=1 Tax=Daktulosphaira vitifoliae TaxID=58002 RepID=UPI0021AA6FEE|nr:uncharacterized protein LOC126896732 [Daktulosphaira vitifoliae]